MVYLAPLPTFYRIYRKKSTEGFQSLLYVVAFFSVMLWIYYASLKSDGYLLITINTIGCIIETVYIVMYVVYAPRKAKLKNCFPHACLKESLSSIYTKREGAASWNDKREQIFVFLPFMQWL